MREGEGARKRQRRRVSSMQKTHIHKGLLLLLTMSQRRYLWVVPWNSCRLRLCDEVSTAKIQSLQYWLYMTAAIIKHSLTGHKKTKKTGQSYNSQRMKSILFFYIPNQCYLPNCSVGSCREFKLKDSFPQNYPQSFSRKRSHFYRDDWYLILEQILLMLSPRGRLFSGSSEAENVSIFSVSKMSTTRAKKICTLCSVHSGKQTYKTPRPLKVLSLPLYFFHSL